MKKHKDCLYCTARGSNAVGRFTEDGSRFIVLAGSVISKTETKSCLKSSHDEREALLADGSIDTWMLTRDVAFRGISHACRIVTGGLGDGNNLWRDCEGDNYWMSRIFFDEEDFLWDDED